MSKFAYVVVGLVALFVALKVMGAITAFVLGNVLGAVIGLVALAGAYQVGKLQGRSEKRITKGY